MNAARRAIIEDLKAAGMTPKEAYETSKDPEYMADWIHVTINDKQKQPKTKKKPHWSARLRFFKQLKAFREARALEKNK